MKLTELLNPWLKQGLPDTILQGMHNDSRKINPGFLFLAYPGAATDGRLYLAQAVKAGAIAALYEPQQWPANAVLPTEIPCVPFPGLSNQLAALASRFYGEPAKKLSITGITGTNGKTTIAYQLAQAHDLLGKNAAYIGTLGQGKVDALQTLFNTTPDALCLQQLFQRFYQEGTSHICMEVSSHALSQGRVDCIDFQQAIYTNLSHEHLDYHQTMDNYAAAKALLFAKESLQWAIVNADDSYSKYMRVVPKHCQILSYGFQKEAQVRATHCEVSLAGTHLQLDSPWGKQALQINAIGFFNVYNTLAVFSSLLAYGYPVEAVISVIAQLKPAPGRMEIVSRDPFTIVDYAHSPDALENVLVTLNKVKKGRILLVFGCGGERDGGKRPLMGKIASEHADIAIITSDNPRSENPDAIMAAIESGMTDKAHVYKISDRKQAIAKALNLANKEDIVLIAGKGHEAYQQIGLERHPFSDQSVILDLLSEQSTQNYPNNAPNFEVSSQK